MKNRNITINQVSILNSETINSDPPKNIFYLDTGNITRNVIEEIQFLDSTHSPFPSRAQRKVKNGTIIYSTVRPILEHFGFIENPKENFIVSTGFVTLDVTDKEIDPKFLYYSITRIEITNYLHTIAVNNVSSYPSINPDDLGNLEISIPKSINVQKNIANFISIIDSKIELNNRINFELEEMAKTIYDYWFVQFDFPDENSRPYKSSGGKMVWNEELKREIPEGWESIKIGTILSKNNKKKKIPKSKIQLDGKIPIIDQSTEFIAGFTNDIDSIIESATPKIIFGDHTRILKFINFDFAQGADGTQLLFSKNNRMPQHLLYQALNQIDLSNYGYARHFKFLKEFNIVLPNENIALRYDLIAKNFYDIIKVNIFQNLELSKLRDWLLPMLMNGQVKVG